MKACVILVKRLIMNWNFPLIEYKNNKKKTYRKDSFGNLKQFQHQLGIISFFVSFMEISLKNMGVKTV